MIELPNFEEPWKYENGFYLTCQTTRMSKILAHYELFKETMNLPGEIVECGVFKGASLARFAMFRDLFGNEYSREIIAFDTFGEFPEAEYDSDKQYREQYISAAGDESVSKDQMKKILNNKDCEENVSLIKGDIMDTIPNYVENNQHLKISLLNLDTDLYEPAKVVLENLYPRVVKGGVVILDNYGTFPGETKAVEGYFKKNNLEKKIKKFRFSMTPSYIVK